MSNEKVLNINGGEEFKQKVLESELPVMVDFWAPWCMPCRMMAPILDELAGIMDGQLVVAKVDTENTLNQNLAYEYNIQSIPNMKLFKGGKVVNEFVGLRDLGTLKQEIENVI
ncbi:thioredoxin [Patescibacteria group bacterium]|nr:thioredoxin [Patescibacteria group bacterium]